MKWYFHIVNWRKWFAGRGRTQQLRLLKQQRQLLHTGMETTAEVLNSTIESETVGNLLPVSLWLRLKQSDGSYCYIKSKTLVPLRQLPVIGQLLRIRYSPENPANVLII